ncbi:MAG: hypothetical protein U9R48_10805 [Chloroflexota bacterium]|nr:hypothetical protein [Chloroflexota bacterium]
MVKATENPDVMSSVIRWVARVWSIVSLGFMLLMVGGELLSPTGQLPSAARDLLGMVFFPVGVCAGLVVAWWREGLGGAVTVGSFLAFYLILWAFDGRFPRGPYFALVAAPGVLFLLLWGITLIENQGKPLHDTT